MDDSLFLKVFVLALTFYAANTSYAANFKKSETYVQDCYEAYPYEQWEEEITEFIQEYMSVLLPSQKITSTPTSLEAIQNTKYTEVSDEEC